MPELLMYEHVVDEPLLKGRHEALASENVKRMIASPLTLLDGSVATLTFYWRTEGKFTDLDRDYATALSNFASAALNQQTLLEKANAKQSA